MLSLPLPAGSGDPGAFAHKVLCWHLFPCRGTRLQVQGTNPLVQTFKRGATRPGLLSSYSGHPLRPGRLLRAHPALLLWSLGPQPLPRSPQNRRALLSWEGGSPQQGASWARPPTVATSQGGMSAAGSTALSLSFLFYAMGGRVCSE